MIFNSHLHSAPFFHRRFKDKKTEDPAALCPDHQRSSWAPRESPVGNQSLFCFIAESDVDKDERLLEITNYIYANYKDVTLDDLAEKFFLSKPYLSKYIKEKSGMTFGDILKKVRMKKARAMLKSSSATVESIAESVGYQNVEHFNRVFKKMYNITPVQYRNRK